MNIFALLPMIFNLGLPVIESIVGKDKAKLVVDGLQKVVGDNKNLLKEQAKILIASDANQTSINKIDARSNSIWQSGWRPMCGWVCGLGLIYALIGQNVANIYFISIGAPTLDPIDTNLLMTLTFAMLGLAGVRSLDKNNQNKNKY